MAKADTKSRIENLLEKLPVAQQQQLLEFAEFLSARYPSTTEASVTEPLPIERPADETVVAAMKRLRETYPMLDPEKLLHEASGLMSSHMLQGRPAAEVIDELEQLFRQHFNAL